MKTRAKLLIGTWLATPLMWLPLTGLAQTAGQTDAKVTAQATADDASKDKDTTLVVVTGKFLDRNASSGTKLKIPVMDTPMTVATYSGSFMRAIEVTQVADLYKYMTGVQRAGNTGYDMTLRGFKTAATDRNAIMTDGLPGLTVRFGSPPTIGTDHVEVVKGPASIFYGQVQPGGFVNIVTKKPERFQHTEIEATGDASLAGYGHQGGGAIAVDSTGPVPGTDKHLLYRIVAQGGSTHGFRDNDFEYPVYVAPSLTWEMSSKTRATLQLEYRRTKTHYDSYLVAPGNLIANVAPINTTYQEPGDSQYERGTTASLFVTHDFSTNLHGNLSYRYVNHQDGATGLDVNKISADGLTLTRRVRGQINKRTYGFGDANLLWDFKVVGIANKLVTGVNWGKETSDFDRTQFFNAPNTGADSLTVSVLDPQHGLARDYSTYPAVNSNTPQNLNDRLTTNNAFGVYISDLITFTPQLKAMIGARYSKEDFTISELKLPNVPTQSGSNHDALPMAGIVYEPSKSWSLYASYSTSFVPVPASNQDINGQYSFTPTTASSVEVGLKSDLLDHRLRFTMASFDIRKKHVINTFTCPLGTCAEQLGAEESKGQELEINAQPIPNWQILFGYSHLDSIVSQSNIANQVGALLPNVPKDNAHIWTRYDITKGALNGLGLGLGVSYVSARNGLLPTAASTDTLTMPAYTITDLALYYTIRNVDLTLKVSNLFNTRYYASASSAIAIMPGEPETMTLTLRTHF